MQTTKQALVIGAMGGLASATIQLLLAHGWHVYAADVQPQVIKHYAQMPNITPLVMDITNGRSVSEAFEHISAQTAGLDAIIHMAGVLNIGSMVELPVTTLQKALEINLHGVYRVNKNFLPLLISRHGRIIILSSEAGRQAAAPFNGIYAISKHALEAYADALRRELAFLNIKVIKLQPGPLKTNLTKNIMPLFNMAREQSTYFKANLARGITYLPKVYQKAHDPQIVAKKVLFVLNSAHPHTAYSIKPDLTRLLLDFLPVRWADYLIKKYLS